MKYYKAKWLTAKEEYPFRMVFEVGSDNFENRKIEFYESGKYGYSYADVEFNNTRLGVYPIPPIEEVNENPEFEMIEIKKNEFEFLWNLLVKNNAPNATVEDNS